MLMTLTLNGVTKDYTLLEVLQLKPNPSERDAVVRAILNQLPSAPIEIDPISHARAGIFWLMAFVIAFPEIKGSDIAAQQLLSSGYVEKLIDLNEMTDRFAVRAMVELVKKLLQIFPSLEKPIEPLLARKIPILVKREEDLPHVRKLYKTFPELESKIYVHLMKRIQNLKASVAEEKRVTGKKRGLFYEPRVNTILPDEDRMPHPTKRIRPSN